MTPRRLLGMGLCLLACLLVLWQWPQGQGSDAPARLLPGFEARREAVASIQLRGAGDALLVELDKADGQWRVMQRGGWPANARVAELLDALSQARRIEAKTARAERFPRLGVQAVDDPAATGVEVRLLGGTSETRIVFGDPASMAGQRYARLAAEDQAWQIDRDPDLPREPADWLAVDLIDRPLARIARVELTPSTGKSFWLAREPAGDHFGLEGQPAAALADPGRGDATAAFLDGLELVDVAEDAATPALMRARFVGVDGLDLAIEAWQQNGQSWMRCQPALDTARSQAWFARLPKDGAEAKAGLAALQAQFAQVSERCQGHAFRLPDYKAGNLLRSREQYLAD